MRRRLPGIRLISYFALAFVVTVGLTLALNIAFFGMMMYQFWKYNIDYVGGGTIMEALTLTDEGYVLSEEMQEELARGQQWAMLLDEDGEAIWSYGKPDEVKESYSRSEIARMSKWYLQEYPVRMRVWEDRIMVVGMPRYTVWKYTLEFPIPFLDYCKKIWFWMLLFNLLWFLALAVFFTRRWSKGREEARLEWISGISHDIRTPLSMVMGYSDTLVGCGNLSERERQQMAAIRRQSLVMKELVEDLNMTSALEYSMQAIRVERIRPAVMLREVAAAFLSDARDGELEIEIEVSGPAEEVWIKADRKLLVRALRNLFHNSIQHSQQDETMVVRLRMWREKRWCCISFADNGVGYSPEMLHQLCSRKKERASQNIRGLGIVRKVVLTHRGRIRFENNPEGGSFCEMRFRIAGGFAKKQGIDDKIDAILRKKL